MITVTLPDGSKKQYESVVRAYDVAVDISEGLARVAIAAKVEDVLVDLSTELSTDCRLAIVRESDAEGVEILRHSAAHLLAQAVTQLYPEVKVAIGPVIEDGFYYDFDFHRPFTPEDLTAIEAKMRQLAKADQAITRTVIDRASALALFKEKGEIYKVELIQDLPEGETLSLYHQGEFTDLCRGPHLPSTKFIKHFKLMRVAGAYWRGDSKNTMLQRIYGTAFSSKAGLADHLHFLEEAEKRDHRKLGKQLDLFHFQEEAPGMVFWHGRGWTLYQQVIQYMRQALWDNDYQEVNAPLIMDRTLWEKSGHWDKFRDAMFTTSSEDRVYAIKPMNCPGHLQIFNQGLKSYRDLPLKLGEFGLDHRNEPSGALHGLMRLRQFTQDDAHVFCTEAQVLEEVRKLIDLVYQTYRDFGFTDIVVRLATRPDQRIGEDAVWNHSEAALEKALNDYGLQWTFAPGEGAFYGPKIEFHLKDSLKRVWQCGTVQVDFSMPGRLGAEYVAEDNSRKTPVMIHRVIVGSVDRFIGILLEHYAGNLPVWLSPEQVVVMNITDRQVDYTKEITTILKKNGIRAKYDLRNEKIGFKIREHILERIPYLLVVGDKEVEEQTVSVRRRGGEDLGSMRIETFLERLRDTIEKREV